MSNESTTAAGMNRAKPYPVSYTHLMSGVFLLSCLFIYICAAMPPGAAVYCAAWAIISQQIAHESAFIVLRSMGIGGQLSAIGYMVVIYAVIYGTVSYTHLDVYKRQSGDGA